MLLKRVAAILLFVAVFPGVYAQQLRNPILPGFYPDPSIVKVGTDYYLVNSTFSYYPGIPVWHSKDLYNWEQVGNVIDRPSQMDFMGENVSRGLFAPAIRYHDGLFYVTCTDIDHDGNFVVTASSPAGPWSQPVRLPEVHGIDPSLFFDTDGKAYILYNSDAPDGKPLYSGHRTIRIYEFDYHNLKVVGGETLLVNGGVDLSQKPVWIEGPHIYKRGNYYYLMAAEGGTSENHSEVVFRSSGVRGPYVPYEHNPILTQRGVKSSVTSAGHADLVEGPDGGTYAVFLAVRPYEGDYYNTGRETFITPVRWVDDWPVMDRVRYAFDVPFKVGKAGSGGSARAAAALPVNGNFTHRYRFENLLKSGWLFLRTYDSSWYRVRGGELTMKLLPETYMGKGNPAFLARRQQHLTCSVSTEMEFSSSVAGEKAGLVVFQNLRNNYFICRSEGKVQLYQGDSLLAESALAGAPEKLYLKISANRGEYSFSYALAKDRWSVLKDHVDGKLLSTKVAGGFVGSVFAVYGTSSGAVSESKARFSWFEYMGKDPTYE
ncbi:MAG: glycoside hydrolase family 43 protein [Bacteroidetes bacterium]|nr:glycoside hydrolase family 43 protein [Bacteroidota bacterium]